MSIPTNEQIQKWRNRWDKYPGLADEIADILVGDGPTENREKAIERMWQVKSLILSSGNTIDFQDFDKDYNNPKIPSLDLRGINWESKKLTSIYIPMVHLEGAWMPQAICDGVTFDLGHFEKAQLEEISLKNAKLVNCKMNEASLQDANLENTNLDRAHLENANLHYVSLKKSNLSHAYLDNAHISEANLRFVNLSSSSLKGTDIIFSNLSHADLVNAHLEEASFQGSILNYANFTLARLESTSFWDATIEGTIFYRSVFGNNKQIYQVSNKNEKLVLNETNLSTYFKNNTFLPKINIKNSHSFSVIKQLFINRWFFTDFRGTNIEEADFSGAGDLKRYILDQQFLDRFKTNHPAGYWIWNITTNCGWSVWRVAFWSIFAILFFAGIYGIPYPIPQWMPDSLATFISNIFGIDPNFSMMNYSQILDKAPDLPRFWQLFYISFDIFTNLGIRTTFPMNWQGVVVMFAETVTGFVALGMMISVLTNRFARRS